MEQKKHLLAPGHTACAGCGLSMGARMVVDAAGPNTIIANCTGCLEVFTTRYPQSAWEVPWVHSLFENGAAIGAGIETALKALGREGEARVIAQGGDGGTADIGLQALSGMWERGHDVLYICYDNEAYMNTGVQRSSQTPTWSNTSTTPTGKISYGNPTRKKNMFQIAVAHDVAYAATATVGFDMDLKAKVKKALSIRGPKYLHVLVPCPLGWKVESKNTIKIAKKAVNCGIFPLLEFENGKVTGRKIGTIEPVNEYLKMQGRFKHIVADTDEAKKHVADIQKLADENIEKYGLKA
ncbi:MAG TPA: thiamine pyrophosphate-dependent enzyme [Candidatus Wallbacteria bacterium]|nr:thiamine pyrophosphate-dependent enzyme [Candidatus Wallbacteria bacterium]